MRKTLRPMLVAVLTFLSAVALGAASAMTAAITLAATALIVPGTGTHNITTVMGYLENARDRFIAPANPSCTSSNGCVLVGIPYPASFWPIPLPGWCPGLSCDTWNVSVGTGVANLNSELINQLNNPTPDNQQIVLFGYSQGGAVVSTELSNLAGTFILIPWQGTLPIYQPFMDLASATGTTALVKPFVDLLTPATKVLIDLGYDRTANPGIPQTFKLIPIVNPVTLTVDLVVAVGQGIQAFVNDVGGTTLAPVSPFTTGPSTVSTLAAPNSDPPVNNSVVPIRTRTRSRTRAPTPARSR